MWNQYCVLNSKNPTFKFFPLCTYLHFSSFETQLHLSYWTGTQQFIHGGACNSSGAETDCSWLIKVKKVGYHHSPLHIASCSNTLKRPRADALRKASMLSYFKYQWNITTQNRTWPEKPGTFLSPSKLRYHISITLHISLKEWKSGNLETTPMP